MRISQKCSIALHCLIFINEFGQTNNVNSSLLAKSTGCNPVIIRNIISALNKKGIISVKQGVGNIHLAKEAEEITVDDVYMALEAGERESLIGIHSSPSDLCPVGRNIHSVLEKQYDQIEEDMRSSMRQIKLSHIIEDYHKTLDNEKKGHI